MSTITSLVILDETGQDIVEALDLSDEILTRLFPQ